MLISLRHLCAGGLLSGLMTLTAACSGLENAGSSIGHNPVQPIALSSTKTVNLPHTPVKWQSIGNCWPMRQQAGLNH